MELNDITYSKAEQLSQRLISVSEAAALMRLSTGTLHNWLSMGKHGLRRVKVSGKTFLDRNQIEELLEKSFRGHN